MLMQCQDRITELKAALPDILSCTDLKKESDTSYAGPCPVCSGKDRFVYKTDSGRCWCRYCRPEDQSMDIIDFHCWLTGKTIPDLMREYNINGPAIPTTPARDTSAFEPEAVVKSLKNSMKDIWENRCSTQRPGVIKKFLQDRRGLSKETIDSLLQAGRLKTKIHADKLSMMIAFPSLQGDEIMAIQAISLDGESFPFTEENGGKPKNKVFMGGSNSGGDCFVMFGAPLSDFTEQKKEIVILSEGVINAITAFELFPDTCCIALGSSTCTDKVKALKPFLEHVEKVIVCVDNDSPSEKMLRSIWDILGSKVFSFRWADDDPQGFDINDALQAGQRDRVIDMIQGAEQVWYKQETPSSISQPVKRDDWMFAGERFPKTQFPWEVLPTSLSASLKQLARSCAASPTHLPGIVFGILAAVLGRHVEVRVKSSWSEPLIFWMLALLPSGQGKSPAQNALSAPIYVEQERLDTAHKQALTAWKALPADEQAQNPKPEPLGGIFTSDMTIEGLRHDQRACGGILISNDEASSFFEGQNQYKKSGKGTDRESWLKLYDGNPARIVRTSGAVFLKGARASIIGGTQPGVFWRIFRTDSNGDDIFLVDGTLFRFLMTWEGDKFYPMTMESWDDANRAVWDNLIHNALSFCQAHTGVTIDGDEEVFTHSLWLSEATLEMFVDWSNELKGITSRLPEHVRGYIPKLIGWAVRLTGIIKCLESFLAGTKVPQVIDPDDLQKGIRLAEFYMGHNVDVIQAIVTSTCPAKETFTDQEIHLARTLQDIKGDVDSGRLAIGFIWEKFNEGCPPELQYKSSRAMGSLIRSCGLTVSGGKHDANGKRAVNCLEWDKTTDLYIENCLQSLQSLQTKEGQGFPNADINKSKSAMSANNTDIAENMQTLQTLEMQSLQAKTTVNKGDADIADIADVFPCIKSDEVTI